LLDWFRSHKGGMMFTPVLWNLEQTVQSNVGILQVRSGAKRIRIQTEIRSDTYVYADREMLDLILRNLLSNAIKFTEEGGSIQVKADQAKDKVVVSIKDQGNGMVPEQADSLLKEAYPVSGTGTAGERGLGMGLALCREFVRINGGEIWFESAPNEGSTFYFSVPAAGGGAA
jgi:signal transduction histidine kinase